MQKKVGHVTNSCSGCGDNMIFSPESQSLFCPSCKKTKEIVSNTNISKYDVTSAENAADKNLVWMETSKSMQCPNCGARVVLSNYQTSSSCPYCDTSLIALTNEFNVKSPDAIIPFAISKQQAKLKFKEINKHRWFAPKQFKNSSNVDEIHAYYFPAYIFEGNCHSEYKGKLYEEIEKEDRNGLKQTEKKYFLISGNKDTYHSNVEIAASTKISQYDLDGIHPYKLDYAKCYNNDYVYGYELECSSTSLETATDLAKNCIEKDIKKQILEKYSYDGVEYLDVKTYYNSFKYSQYALPMYRINFTYKNNKYSNVMNGQTGKLTGKYPKSTAKISLFVALILLILGLPFLIILLSM